MIERPFGRRSGFAVPRANIGGMRLPPDPDQAAALVRHAIDSGMKYVDTSRGYGDSEIKIGKALKDGYREKVILSTKWSPWIKKIEETDDASADCVRKRIEESMKRLDVDYLDYYQIWNIDSREHYRQAVAKGGMLDGIQKAVREGLVGHIGLTTHDKVPDLLSYTNEIDWCEIILITYNLLNTHYAPVLKAAHEKGIGTIVMNPVGGGRLAQPSRVLGQLAERVGAAGPADLAVRYIMSNPHVDTIICGMTKPSDVDDTIRSANAGPLAADQMKHIDAFLDAIAKERKRFCTGCRYCLPCPKGIDIPAVMGAVFDDRVLDFKALARQRYRNMKTPKADICAHCGECREKCPQKLDVPTELEWANMAYSE